MKKKNIYIFTLRMCENDFSLKFTKNKIFWGAKFVLTFHLGNSKQAALEALMILQTNVTT